LGHRRTGQEGGEARRERRDPDRPTRAWGKGAERLRTTGGSRFPEAGRGKKSHENSIILSKRAHGKNYFLSTSRVKLR
jgi:hypothetical protein